MSDCDCRTQQFSCQRVAVVCRLLLHSLQKVKALACQGFCQNPIECPQVAPPDNVPWLRPSTLRAQHSTAQHSTAQHLSLLAVATAGQRPLQRPHSTARQQGTAQHCWQAVRTPQFPCRNNCYSCSQHDGHLGRLVMTPRAALAPKRGAWPKPVTVTVMTRDAVSRVSIPAGGRSSLAGSVQQ